MIIVEWLQWLLLWVGEKFLTHNQWVKIRDLVGWSVVACKKRPKFQPHFVVDRWDDEGIWIIRIPRRLATMTELVDVFD